MIRTGPGKWKQIAENISMIYNFDIGGDAPKWEHILYLREAIAPVLRGGGGIALHGFTDRAGSGEANYALAKSRARKTLAFLQLEVRNGFANRTFGHMETLAFYPANVNLNDGTYTEHSRGVALCLQPQLSSQKGPVLIPEVPSNWWQLAGSH